jgi:flagellar basal-body rod modification protein FlgD
MSTTVDNTASTSAASKYLTDYDWTNGSSRTVSKTLTQEDFLSLVAAEMTNQDPLNPTSNTEYIAQMAQFSTLEQSKAMQQDISALQASNLIGRSVTVEDDEQNIFQGTVTSVLLEKGVPSVEVNGVFYSMDSLIAIEPVATPTTPNS